jgi:HSP20 family protein
MTAHRPRQTDYADEVGLVEELLFGAASPRTGWRAAIWVPTTDVYETDDQVVVQVEIAGTKQSDLSVSLHDRRLTISGTRIDHGPAHRAYHQLQVRYGEFRTAVDLPVAVDEVHVDAEYSDGFLRIVLPKLRPRHIDVQE